MEDKKIMIKQIDNEIREKGLLKNKLLKEMDDLQNRKYEIEYGYKIGDEIMIDGKRAVIVEFSILGLRVKFYTKSGDINISTNIIYCDNFDKMTKYNKRTT